jgi:hypothetical protein
MTEIKPDDFTLLVSKLKDISGLITATDVHNKHIAKFETRQYKRYLLQMAVTKGLAWSNGKLPSDKKYGIYFNAENRVDVVIEKTFDPCVLDSPNIIDLPPRIMKMSINIEKHEYWNTQKEHWTDVYQLLCGYQNEGKINLNLLPESYIDEKKQLISFQARELILIYKILKLGWVEMKIHLSSYVGDHNVMFEEMLWASSVCRFRTNSINLIDRPRAQLNYLRQLHDSQSGIADYPKAKDQFLGTHLDEYWQASKGVLDRFSRGVHIENALKSTQNDDIKKLFAEWEELNQEVKTFNMKALSRKNDKSRTKKFEKKMLKQYVKTLPPSSIEKKSIELYLKTLETE